MLCCVVLPKRGLAALLALAFALSLSANYAAAQAASSPKNEVYLGYSWLRPDGNVDWGSVPNIVAGGDLSVTHYFANAQNLGVIVDGSVHSGKGANNKLGANIGLGLAGLQYKLHNHPVSPFFRVMGGAAYLDPDLLRIEWKPAIDVGAGLDVSLGKAFSIRIVQADYIWTYYREQNFTHSGDNLNMIRLSAGVVFNLGYYNNVPATSACTAQPNDVMEGEPIKLAATGSNFNPKHTLTYAWTTNGGKLQSAGAQNATIDTTGIAAGSYKADATVTDAKEKKNNSATCSAAFTVRAKPMNPPQVSCSVSPSTVQAGSPVTITASVTSPDGAQITSTSYQASGGHVSGTGNTATEDTAGVSPGNVTITVSATDARNLTGTGTCSFSVEAPPPAPQVTNISSIQFPDKKRPWRVDNTAKAILDDVASRLKADPNAKIAIVGYADGEKAPMEGTGKKRQPMDLAGQRAVNAKAYLVQQQGIDPGRIEVRKGTGKSETADIDWIPQGADVASASILQGTTPVNESVVKPSTNAYPMPHTAAPSHHRKAAAAPSQ